MDGLRDELRHIRNANRSAKNRREGKIGDISSEFIAGMIEQQDMPTRKEYDKKTGTWLVVPENTRDFEDVDNFEQALKDAKDKRGIK